MACRWAGRRTKGEERVEFELAESQSRKRDVRPRLSPVLLA